MGTLLDDYEQQYSTLTAEITAQIGRLSVAPIPAEKVKFITEINRQVDEAQELLEQIGLEIREAPAATRAGLTARLHCYQAELKRLQQEFTNAKAVKPPGEYESEFEEIGILQEDQKRRLLDNTEKLERTGKHLNDGYRIVIETQEIGNQVLQDLHQQRETMTRTRSRLREIDADLGRSSRLMNSMIMRKLREKFILILVGVVFVLAVTMSIYFSFRHIK